MSFTVTQQGGTQELAFEAYVRLLGKSGVKVDRLKRVPEPGTQSRWLPVWPARKEAETFREALVRDTRDKGWFVHELTPAEQEQVTEGPLGPISIYFGIQHDGRAFALHPQSREFVQEKYPRAACIDSVFVGLTPPADWTRVGNSQDTLYEQIALMLTGLSKGQLAEFGGFRVYDPTREQEVYRRTNLINAE